MRRFAPPLAAALALLLAGAVPALAGAGLPRLASLRAGPLAATISNDSPGLVVGANTLTVAIPSLPERHVVSLALRGPAGEVLDVPLRRLLVLGGGNAHGLGGEHGSDAGHGSGDAHAAEPGAPPHTAAASTAPNVPTLPAASAGDPRNAPPDAHPAPGHVMSTEHHDSAAPTPAAAAHHDAPVGVIASPAGAAEHHAPVVVPAQTAALPALAGTHSADGHVDDGHAHAAAGLAGAEAGYLARGRVTIPTTGRWTLALTVRAAAGDRYTDEASLDVVEGGPSRLYLAGTGAVMGGFLLFGAVQRRQQPAARGPRKGR